MEEEYEIKGTEEYETFCQIRILVMHLCEIGKVDYKKVPGMSSIIDNIAGLIMSIKTRTFLEDEEYDIEEIKIDSVQNHSGNKKIN